MTKVIDHKTQKKLAFQSKLLTIRCVTDFNFDKTYSIVFAGVFCWR